MARRYVKQMRISKGMTLAELVKEYKQAGVLGAGRVARAVDIIRSLFESPEYLVFLAMAGPMVPGGLREIIADLVRTGRVHAIVTSGANIVHDVLEAIGGHHVKGSLKADDRKLAKQQLGRAGDVYIETAGFEKFETTIRSILEQIPEAIRVEGLSPSELIGYIGEQVKDEHSIVHQARLQNVPIFCPGILDSMLGLHIALYSQIKPLKLNGLKDMEILYDCVHEAKRIGAIILGGGLPKHFTLGANILRGGLDSAIQITTAREEDGSLSGAKLQEGISWGKVKATAVFETVIGDATVLFPLLIGAVLEQMDSD
ncbi:MAG: deoxyhypusine synthase [Candidatus Hodarchaeota archaeon]